MLDELGLSNLLDDPDQFRNLLEMMKQLKAVLDRHGFGEFLRNPKGLADVLSKYNGMKKAFEEHGFEELFEDPYNLKGFLRNYSKIRDAFRATGLEYLLDSSPAMREFLAKHTKEGAELKEVRERAATLEDMEKLLLRREEELRAAREEAAALKQQLDKYEKLGTCAELARLKQEHAQFSADLKSMKKRQSLSDSQVRDLEDRLISQEQERQDALVQWRVMFDKFKELDIFKLDVIAREMKGVLNKVELVEKETKHLRDDAGKLKDYGDRQHIASSSSKMQDQCKQVAAHIHDVIQKCFNDRQRQHIGVATDNEYKADDRRDGRLVEGGSMIYGVQEEMDKAALALLANVTAPPVERPDYGKSKAARLVHNDAVRTSPDQYRPPR